MKWNRIIFLLTFIVIICCKDKTLNNEQSIQINKFSDEEIIKIYQLKDSGNGKELLPYLSHRNPVYREEAALSFASLQDTDAITPLAKLLKDSIENVRIVASFSLGQIKNNKAEPFLIHSFKNEKSFLVKYTQLEAIGKCGTDKGLEFIIQLTVNCVDTFLCVGQAWGIYRFGLRKIINPSGTKKMLSFLHKNNSDDVRFIASAYFARVKDVDLTGYKETILKSLNEDSNAYIRMNMATASAKINDPIVVNSLNSALLTDLDYRVKVNAVRSLGKFPHTFTKKNYVFELLFDSNSHVSMTAANHFIEHGLTEDAGLYFEASKQISNYRTRALLMSAAMKWAKYKSGIYSRKLIRKTIDSLLDVSTNFYEKGLLIQALAQDLNEYKSIIRYCFETDMPVIKTYAMEALINIRKNNDFEKIFNTKNLKEEIAGCFKKGIESGDVALIGLAAEVLAEPSLNYRDFFKDYKFLTNTQQKLKLPKEIETYLALQKTINYFNNTEAKPILNYKPEPDSSIWSKLKKILPAQQISIETTKGEIEVELFLNHAPLSVINLVELINKNFYKNAIFHRVVPNFVIQTGCPRGDGWGSTDYTIRSEFAPVHYSECFMGMASAGKDTESCQWFITHSPTPHLDGNYTIIGRVVKGVDVIHLIEMGDSIKHIRLL